MTQVWQDGKALPVTVLRFLGSNEDLKKLEVGMKIVVSGLSKGKGFQGVVKRHGFSGGPKSHGQKHSHRAPGSIGATAPQRTIPGRKMPGRAGGKRITIKNISIVGKDEKDKSIIIHGAVPGMRGTKLDIKY